MKKLNAFLKEINNNTNNVKFISLKGLDNDIKEKLLNLENQQINECCGCCCNTKCCDPICSCDEPQLIWFYSQKEIVDKLNNVPKCSDIYNIHNQFDNRFKFKGTTPATTREPLYFKEITYSNEAYEYYNKYMQNQKLYNFIKEISDKFTLGYPIVLDKVDGKLQIFFNTNSGTNGEECSIKSSLIKMAKVLTGLESYEEINWAQILDVSIDNADDVYTFVVTITIEPVFFNDNE